MAVLLGGGEAEMFAIRERVDDAQSECAACDAGFRQRQPGFLSAVRIFWQLAGELPVHRPALLDISVCADCRQF